MGGAHGLVPPDTATGLWFVDPTPAELEEEPDDDPDEEDDPDDVEPVEVEPFEVEPFEVEDPSSLEEPVLPLDVVPVEPLDPEVEPEVAGTTVAGDACPGISWATTPTTASVAPAAAAVDHQKTRLTSDWACDRRWRCWAMWAWS